MTDDADIWHKPVSWWLGGTLKSGLQSIIAHTLGNFLDKRELQSRYPDEVLTKSSAHEVLVDYVADTGDGFTATYSVFSQFNPTNMGHSDILVMGGDQVYPTPSAKAYAERFVAPLRSAVPKPFLEHVQELVDQGEIDAARSLLHHDQGDQPWLGHQRQLLATALNLANRAQLIAELELEEPDSQTNAGTVEADGVGAETTSLPLDPPWLLAIPGNHDWYDGLTAFDRVFMQPGESIGAFQTRQHRSYWAVDVEVDGKRWWLWGIDLSLDSYVDRAQLEYFHQCGAAPGEPVVMFVAAPLWTYAKHRVEHLYQFERSAIYERGLRLAMVIAGDRHYYMRREAVQEDANGGRRADAPPRITAGLGGSFGQPPHLEKVTPPLWSGGPNMSAAPRHELTYRAAKLQPRDLGRSRGTVTPRSFPSEPESRRSSGLRKSLSAWGRWNRGFTLLPLILGLLTAALVIQTSEFSTWKPVPTPNRSACSCRRELSDGSVFPKQDSPSPFPRCKSIAGPFPLPRAGLSRETDQGYEGLSRL